MLRIFLTVSVLFWNHLAAQNPVGKVIELCERDDCLKPEVVIKDKNYYEFEFEFRQWVQTEVDAEDIESALAIGLEKLFSYARCGNVAATVVPLSAPWGFFGYLENGKIQQRFSVFLRIVSEVNNPPEPTDPTVTLQTGPLLWYYIRTFDTKVDDQQTEERVIQLLKDLEKDNRPFNSTFFGVPYYSTHGLMEIGFEKTGE
ncbi:heme-binding protein 2-like [Scyliorhinus canicula]|uniref:heme-binding protein 2-like n=1 Tax=Scyliorhinus canicula TaxID=7830 RepID=UPI0018F2BAF5|nr:heme-binding protein 2-like [Scyliorhinus canicula]